MRYAHLLLDFDRTLNDSDRVYEKNLQGFLGLSGETVLKHWEAVHREVIAKHPPKQHENLDLHYEIILERIAHAGRGAVTIELRKRIRAAQEECWYATELFPEALPFLNRLADAGYVLHLATGDYAKLKARKVEEQAGRRFFTNTYDEETLGVGKGKRVYFDRIVQRLGMAPEHLLILGDSIPNDVASGLEAGLGAIWLRRKEEKVRDGLQPNLVVKTLTEALPYFEAA